MTLLEKFKSHFPDNSEQDYLDFEKMDDQKLKEEYFILLDKMLENPNKIFRRTNNRFTNLSYYIATKWVYKD